jgi:hypothetical protein
MGVVMWLGYDTMLKNSGTAECLNPDKH